MHKTREKRHYIQGGLGRVIRYRGRLGLGIGFYTGPELATHLQLILITKGNQFLNYVVHNMTKNNLFLKLVVISD